MIGQPITGSAHGREHGVTIAVGYVRSDRPGRERLERMVDRVQEFSNQRGYLLRGVFCDEATNPSIPLGARPGLRRVINTTADADVIVVPSRDHFSTFSGIREFIENEIRRTGTPVVVIDETGRGRE